MIKYLKKIIFIFLTLSFALSFAHIDITPIGFDMKPTQHARIFLPFLKALFK
jgi:hypothetical protein